MLKYEDIVSQAEQSVGLADTDPQSIQNNLACLIDSLNTDERLPETAETQIRDSLVMRVAERLQAQKWMAEYPEIANEVIQEPVFLCGLPRSGTTYFQYLFDCDDRFRLIRTWEAVSPFPPPGLDPASVEQRKAEEQARREKLRPKVKNFDAMHLVDADGPEECHAFMEQSHSAVGFHNLFNVPGYFGYLKQTLDFDAAYQLHRRQLQLLQWRSPERRWAVKYPGHVLAMDSICRVYPDARFVLTHRDPVQTLASLCKLTLALRSARYERAFDPLVVGQQMLDFVQFHIDRILSFVSDAQASRAIHVDYYRLVRDPVAEMKRVHSALGIETPAHSATAMQQWFDNNPKGARGVHVYSLSEFGLCEDAVAEQFSTYMQHFAIPREADGLASVG